MKNGRFRIGVVAPGSRVDASLADRIQGAALDLYPDRAPEIYFHPQCFLSSGHFAGDDEARLGAIAEIANDGSFDALWFARGGYGACRLVQRLLPALTEAARHKAYLGYSDAAIILAALYRHGFAKLAHGPMAIDLTRDGGKAAIGRALAYLIDADPSTLEPSIASNRPTAAFNITILSNLLGTPFQPDLSGHVLMLEEVSEHMYRIDRSLFHITSNADIGKVAGIMLGRCDDIPENDRDFGQTEEEIVTHWCTASGIPYLGRADIGHDADNKIVPFGSPSRGDHV